MKTLPIFLVDAFADRAFSGNPAAVCLLSESREDAWMQALAGEMNQSETAFVLPTEDGYSLRWFTPKVEVDLCGHATLAAAHVLWESGILKRDQPARFHTRSGLLIATCREGAMELDFPTTPAKPVTPDPIYERILGCRIVSAHRSKFDFLFELESERKVGELCPDMQLLQTLDCRGVIVTAAGSEVDFVSRFFAPRCGIDEDPVTGSAHCALGEFWMKRLGKSELSARQCSKRGGFVQVRVNGERTLLIGRAVTTMRGEVDDPLNH